MPLIIDANRAGDFGSPPAAHAPEILSRIKAKRVTVVLGGDLLRELMGTGLRNLIVEWVRSGRTLRVADEDLVEEIAVVDGLGIRSNDNHIIAIARLSGCRLLYSDDRALVDDFKDTAILSPKGRVFHSTNSADIVNQLMERFGK